MDNSPKTEKYPDIEYVLHIYDTIWDYYKKTLDERTQLLNNYIVFVGIWMKRNGYDYYSVEGGNR